MNVVVAPVVWLIYPELANRTLEEISLLFTSDSLLASENMKEYYRRIGEAGGNTAVAARQLLDEVDGKYLTDATEPGSPNEKRVEVNHNVII